ncbi:hypothetical protein [Sorangium sp. So ce1000]
MSKFKLLEPIWADPRGAPPAAVAATWVGPPRRNLGRPAAP